MIPETSAPVNRQAAIFMSRQKRVLTVTEALQRFALAITEPGVAQQIADMMAQKKSHESPALKLTLSIHSDVRNPGQFFAKMHTSITTEVSETHYGGLDAK